MPEEKAARDIIEKSGLPLAAPSANVSGSPSPTTAEHVISDLDGKIDAVVIGNGCKIGVESTVLSIFDGKASILRPGAVTAEEIEQLLGKVDVDKAVLEEPKSSEKVSSPGMKYKHYAPKTETFLVEGSIQAFVNFVNKKDNALAICFEEESHLISSEKIVYGEMSDKKTLAHNLFSALREADNFKKESIYIHAPDKAGVGLAVYNRLIRAAAFRVIKL